MKNKKSNLRERNLQWNKFIRRRDRIRLLLWKLQRNMIQQKQGVGNFSTNIKNEKKNSLFEHHYYSNTYEVST